MSDDLYFLAVIAAALDAPDPTTALRAAFVQIRREDRVNALAMGEREPGRGGKGKGRRSGVGHGQRFVGIHSTRSRNSSSTTAGFHRGHRWPTHHKPMEFNL